MFSGRGSGRWGPRWRGGAGVRGLALRDLSLERQGPAGAGAGESRWVDDPGQRGPRVPAALPRATWCGSGTLRLGSGVPGGWATPCGAAGRCARPSPPWVRGAEYALVNRLGSGWRSMLTGCGRGPKTVHVSPPTALGGHGCALRTGRLSRPPPFAGGIPPAAVSELGSPRSTQPRMTPPPPATCIKRAALKVCRPPTAPGPGPRSAGRPFQAAELLENSGRALTPAT